MLAIIKCLSSILSCLWWYVSYSPYIPFHLYKVYIPITLKHDKRPNKLQSTLKVHSNENDLNATINLPDLTFGGYASNCKFTLYTLSMHYQLTTLYTSWTLKNSKLYYTCIGLHLPFYQSIVNWLFLVM